MLTETINPALIRDTGFRSSLHGITVGKRVGMTVDLLTMRCSNMVFCVPDSRKSQETNLEDNRHRRPDLSLIMSLPNVNLERSATRIKLCSHVSLTVAICAEEMDCVSLKAGAEPFRPRPALREEVISRDPFQILSRHTCPPGRHAYVQMSICPSCRRRACTSGLPNPCTVSSPSS